MKLGICLTFAMALAGCAAPSTSTNRAESNPLSSDLSDRVTQSRAVEAAIWGIPAVNYDLMLQAMLNKTSAKQNEIVFWSKPVDWRNQTLTPNPDAIYLMIFFDTKTAGPIVIDVPPADTGNFAANIDTIWQMPLEDAGPNGADQGKGGKYLILPPEYKDKPPEGYIVVQSDTFCGYALFRSNLARHSDADIAKALAYGKRLKVYPLSQAANPPETKFTDAFGSDFDATIRFDASYFTNLDRIVQNEPWLTRDKAMIDQLRSIGIEKGKTFSPVEKTKGVLAAAAIEARDYIDALYDRGFPPFWTTARWAVPATPQHIQASSSGYTVNGLYPVDDRAITYSIGYIGIKRLGTAQFYLIESKDKDGRALDGNKTYRLHVPADAPTKLYWSATAYDRQTHALIKKMDRASRASNDAVVQKNADGSVDVYFGPKAPPGKESNWVPTDPQRQFELLFRLYGPEQRLFEKTWVLPDIEEAK